MKASYHTNRDGLTQPFLLTDLTRLAKEKQLFARVARDPNPYAHLVHEVYPQDGTFLFAADIGVGPSHSAKGATFYTLQPLKVAL